MGCTQNPETNRVPAAGRTASTAENTQAQAQAHIEAHHLGPPSDDQSENSLSLQAGRLGLYPHGTGHGYGEEGDDSAEGTPGRVRGSKRRRLSQGSGAGHLFQPSPVWRASEGGRAGVRVSSPGWDHNPVPDLGIRERPDSDRRRMRWCPEADVEAALLRESVVVVENSDSMMTIKDSEMIMITMF